MSHAVPPRDGYAPDGFHARRQQRVSEHNARKATEPDVFDGASLPKELAPHGMLTHVMNEEISAKFNTCDAFILEIEPGGHSGKHRHMSEEFLYVLEGSGYDLHWDVDADIQEVFRWKISDKAERYDWRAGDFIFIPVNTAHQHFNTDPNRPVRLYSVTSRMYAAVGFPDVDDLAPASAYQAMQGQEAQP